MQWELVGCALYEGAIRLLITLEARAYIRCIVLQLYIIEFRVYSGFRHRRYDICDHHVSSVVA